MGFVSFLKGKSKFQKLKKFIRLRIYSLQNRPPFIILFKYQFLCLFSSKSTVILQGWFPGYNSLPVKTNNWGDDVSIVLTEQLTSKKAIPYNTLLTSFFRDNYLVIGSVISRINSKSVVWGAGVTYPDLKLKHKPKSVLAVRGPLTRDYLLKNGIDCPDIYGDPALLFPLIYKPEIKNKKYKIGYIPHHRDYDDIRYFKLKTRLLDSDSTIIDLVNYSDWKEIIDRICECELILSASLHGLIISDAYGIKNVWCEFLYKQHNYIKYYDYFLSINRYNHPKIPLLINEQYDSLKYHKYVNDKFEIDLSGLISTCPFNKELLKNAL